VWRVTYIERLRTELQKLMAQRGVDVAEPLPSQTRLSETGLDSLAVFELYSNCGLSVDNLPTGDPTLAELEAWARRTGDQDDFGAP